MAEKKEKKRFENEYESTRKEALERIKQAEEKRNAEERKRAEELRKQMEELKLREEEVIRTWTTCFCWVNIADVKANLVSSVRQLA